MRAQNGFTFASVLVVGAALTASAAAQGEPRVVTILQDHRCMVPTDAPGRGAGGSPPVLATPREGAATIGIAADTVIVERPSSVVNGYVRVLQADGRGGWVQRRRLRPWTVAASPALRCIPAMMSDGRPGVTYAHPG